MAINKAREFEENVERIKLFRLVFFVSFFNSSQIVCLFVRRLGDFTQNYEMNYLLFVKFSPHVSFLSCKSVHFYVHMLYFSIFVSEPWHARRTATSKMQLLWHVTG